MNLPLYEQEFFFFRYLPTHIKSVKNAPKSLGYGALGSSFYVYKWQSNSILIGNIPAVCKQGKFASMRNNPFKLDLTWKMSG